MSADQANAIDLRAGRGQDALRLAVLGTQVFLDTYCPAGIRDTVAREVLATFSVERLAADLAHPGTRFVVAEHDIDGAVHSVGYAQVTLGVRHEAVPITAPDDVQAELLRLYVQEPFTGAGLGTRLLRAAEVVARDAGGAVLWLTPWVHNTRALAFYRQRGYADLGSTWFRFEGEVHENRVFARRLVQSPNRTSTG